jgi:FkbM family methyltransferase
MTIQKALRTVQNYVPAGRDLREALSRQYRRVRGRVRGQPHEPDFAALRYFPPDQLLLDVGANYGQSIDSMLLMQPASTIISFEPNVELATQITTLFHADPRVTVRPVGLSDMPGSFDLYVPSYRGFPYPGLASLKEMEAQNWLSPETLYLFRSKHLIIHRIQCSVETLDSQQLSPYFIKIDVQGLEYNVLCGAQETLAQYQPILLLENPGRDTRIADLLRPLGYLEFEFAGGRFLTQISHSTNSFFMTTRRQTDLAEQNPGLFVAELQQPRSAGAVGSRSSSSVTVV